MKNTITTKQKNIFYFKDFLKILKQNSINKGKINWDNFERKFLSKVEKCKTQEDLFKVLNECLRELKDKHSYFIESNKLSGLNKIKKNDKKKKFKSKFINKKWGYLFIPEFSGFNSKEKSKSFSQEVQNAIEMIDNKNPEGWIIDLRENTGGNMWPMLCALGPFFSHKKIGSFIFPNNRKINWYYDRGKSKEGTKVYAEIKSKGYELKEKGLPIAILIGPKTMSSVEAVAIAFHTQRNVRFFGQPTSGRTTCNRGFKLQDDSFLFLTTGNFMDREGKVFKNKIFPDRLIKKEEDIWNIAIKWLKNKSI